MGFPIGLNFLAVDLYLKNMGVDDPWYRNWIFKKLNFYFSKSIEAEMASMNSE
jgi:hypothetical protein